MARIIATLAMCQLGLQSLVGHASTISLQGSGLLLPETAGQTLTLLISGTDYYTDSSIGITINGGVGPAPRVTHILNTSGQSQIPAANFAGTVWADGGVNISDVSYPPNSHGLLPLAGFATAGSEPQNTSGVYATLTVSTVGVPAGSYTMSLVQPGGYPTYLANGLTEKFEPIFVPLELPDIVLSTFIGASPNPHTPISLNNALPPSAPVDLSSAVQLSNSGVVASALVVESATITGPNSELFEIPGGFSPTELLAGEGPLDLGLRFLGAETPGTYTAQIAFSFNDGPDLTYPLVVTVVPEPSSCALALLGIVVVAASRWRRERGVTVA